MEDKNNLIRNWVKIGIVTGLLTSLVYPLLIFVELPRLLTVVLAASFGPLLAIASVGLYQFMQLHKKSVSIQIAVVSNIIAGVILGIMLIVQMALKFPLVDYLKSSNDNAVQELVSWIWKIDLGLDVTWDVYIVLGTFLFAVCMLRHPRFGKLIGLTGILIAGVTLAFNVITFPDPPSESGLLDPGPFVGLWYLAVTIQIMRSLKWMEDSLGRE